MENTPPIPAAPIPSAPVAAEPRHSGVGVASFVISLVGGCGLCLVFAVAGYLQATTPGGLRARHGAAALVGVGAILLVLAHVLGIGLAIGGLAQKDRKKLFAVLGLIFNAGVILLTIGLVVLGRIVKSAGH